MASRVTNLGDSYSRFTEILPEELDDDAAQQLNNARLLLNEIIAEDTDTVRKLLVEKKIIVSLAQFENPSYTIRKALPLRDEQLKRNPEVIKYSLGQWSMSKEVLLHLANKIVEVLPAVRNQYCDYNSLPSQGRKKRIAFIDLTRSYQKFIGLAVNIHDVIEEYEEIFTFLSNRITDHKYNFEAMGKKSTIIPHTELFEAVEELLLRGNYGRFTPAPLIRSVLEVIIFRTILDPKYSSKYKGKNVEVPQETNLEDILTAAKNVNYQFTIETDALSRLYKWGNISIHRAWRMPHSQMWYALVVVKLLSRGIIAVENGEVSKAVDDILDELVKKGKIYVV